MNKVTFFLTSLLTGFFVFSYGSYSPLGDDIPQSNLYPKLETEYKPFVYTPQTRPADYDPYTIPGHAIPAYTASAYQIPVNGHSMNFAYATIHECLEAQADGDESQITFIIDWARYNLIDVNMPSTLGETILHIACRKNFINLANALINNQNTDINLRDQFGHSPLYYSITNNHADLTINLLNRGARFDEQDEDGRNLLHEALLTKFVDYRIVDVLMYYSSTRDNILYRAYNRTLPLHAAIRFDSLEMVHSILSRFPEAAEIAEPNNFAPIALARAQANAHIVTRIEQELEALARARATRTSSSRSSRSTSSSSLTGLPKFGTPSVRFDPTSSFGSSSSSSSSSSTIFNPNAYTSSTSSYSTYVPDTSSRSNFASTELDSEARSSVSSSPSLSPKLLPKHKTPSKTKLSKFSISWKTLGALAVAGMGVAAIIYKLANSSDVADINVSAEVRI